MSTAQDRVRRYPDSGARRLRFPAHVSDAFREEARRIAKVCYGQPKKYDSTGIISSDAVSRVRNGGGWIYQAVQHLRAMRKANVTKADALHPIAFLRGVVEAEYAAPTCFHDANEAETVIDGELDLLQMQAQAGVTDCLPALIEWCGKARARLYDLESSARQRLNEMGTP